MSGRERQSRDLPAWALPDVARTRRLPQVPAPRVAESHSARDSQCVRTIPPTRTGRWSTAWTCQRRRKSFAGAPRLRYACDSCLGPRGLCPGEGCGMLPDIRFVVGAVLASAVMIVTAFGLAATVRVAQHARLAPPDATL